MISISSIFSVSILLFLLIHCQARIIDYGAREESDELSSRERREPKYTVCIHGVKVENRCQCSSEYAGEFCEKKKHCANYRRFHNGSCTQCLPGYTGDHCENLECVHGELNSLGTHCICNAPYNGKFCDELKTENVYSYYNNRVYTMGPLGALLLIPMCACLFGCNYMEKKRDVQRISRQLPYQNINTSKGALVYLLKNDDM